MKLTGVFFEPSKTRANTGTWKGIFRAGHFVKHVPLKAKTKRAALAEAAALLKAL